MAVLRGADSTAADSSAVDSSAALHPAAHLAWFADAGPDDQLADALYAVECDVAANPFAEDVGPLLRALHDAGVRVGVVSDIQVDLRPAFAARTEPGGSTWADLVDVWALSYELGVAKPDPAIFTHALHQFGLPAGEVLVVGHRAGWDGAATEVAMTTLLVPPLRSPDERRLHGVLHGVLDLVLPAGRALRP